jgi:polysaccharide export outer membrane protein
MKQWNCDTENWKRHFVGRVKNADKHKSMYKAYSVKKINKRAILASKEMFRNLCWGLVAILFLGVGFIGGCGGSSQQIIARHSLKQIQPPDPNKALQQQLMLQSSRSSAQNYRDYKVGPEDQLSIEIFGHDQLNRELRVNGQGAITMPLVGAVKVAGLTPQEIETRLMELYDANYLVNPQITVAVEEFRHQQVAVTGAVRDPGSYEIIGPRTLLEVLAMAQGVANDPTRAQAGDAIHVIRRQSAADVAKSMKAGSIQSFSPQTKTTVINLRRLFSGEAPELNLMIESGDVVHVPYAATAYVLGGVKKPGQVAVKESLTVSQAVALAGGVDPLFGTSKIDVIRFDEQGRPLTIKTNLKNIAARKDPDVLIKENDVIMVKVGAVKSTLWVIRQIIPLPGGGYSLGAL